jgi:predicted metal-binding membrane protein
MAVLDKGARPRLLNTRHATVSGPELIALALVALAWVALVAMALQHLLDTSLTGAHASEASGMAGMPGMAATRATASLSVWSRVIAGLPYWLLMTVATMGPVALAGIRHTGLNSLRWRRGRAVAEFSAGYLAVWAAVGVAALGAAESTTTLPREIRLAVVLAGAAAWELSAAKRRASRACHRPLPLPLYGWPAERGALLFGLRQGASCVGTCWCLMLTMVVVTGAHLLWMAALTCLIAMERIAGRPRRVSIITASGLGAAAVATAVLAALQG